MIIPGFHRVISPKGAFPQVADRLDVSLPIHPTEVLIDVHSLNIDSNSYRQIREACKNDLERMKEHIRKIVNESGKMHNPVTGSGGMLIGKVLEVGKDNSSGLKVGEMVSSLVSLTLTPLYLKDIKYLDTSDPRIIVEGYAILFQTSPSVVLPSDIKQNTALAILDVCGAPMLTKVHCKPHDNVLILGGGKSGLLSAFAASENGASVTILENNPSRIKKLKTTGLPFTLERIDALKWSEQFHLQNNFDLVIDCLNIPNAEMAAILAVRKRGTILYFNTATSFTKAALGAEGLGQYAMMVIGNGYYPGHAEYAFDLFRKYRVLTSLLHD